MLLLCFCSAGLAKRFPSPPAPDHLGRPNKTTLLPSPFSLFCLLVRLVFHLRSAPFRRENKHRNAGWQGDRRHEGKEQLRAASERASAGSLGPRSPGPGLASQAERASAGQRASAGGRVQSAFCECAAALGEKRIIVAPARPAPSRRAGPERLRQVVHFPPISGLERKKRARVRE